MEFVRIPAGTFRMGSPPGEPGREAQERQHRVTLSRPVLLGRYEVTQRQWRIVMGTNPSRFADDPDAPVEQVSWLDVQDFLARLTAASRDSRFRLPTEAEWEYACRAGTSTAFATGSVLQADDANVDERVPGTGGPEERFRGRSSRVGAFPPNAWGLFDMHGNVWEWVEDEHCPYPDGAVTDPLARCGAALKVIRGGSWRFGPDSARCALRYTHRPIDSGPSVGFRVVREARQPH